MLFPGLFDTAGQEEMSDVRKLGYGLTDCFIMCYNVVNKESFINIKARWVPELEKHCKGTPFILVGTQIDRRTDAEAVERLKQQKEQPYTYEDGCKLATEIKAAKYVECSSLKQIGVKGVFDEAIRQSLKRQRKSRKKKCLLQ